MAKPALRWPLVSRGRGSLVPSALEEFIQPSKHPLSIIVPLYHSSYQRSDAATYLLRLLPRSTVLTLRAVSKTTKDWVHKDNHNLITSLKLTCPLPPVPSRSSKEMLYTLAPGCRQLSIKLLPSATQIHHGSTLHPSPARQIFKILHSTKSLRVEAPVTDAFYPLLSLRMALEQASIKSLTELHFQNLTLPGLLGLRWGTFDSFVDAAWMGKTFWRGITCLRVAMRSDWLKWAHTDLHREPNVEKRERMRRERDIYRQGIQILHDWFFQFSLIKNMERMLFEWSGGIGPNPFMLEEEVAEEKGGEWFSAPALEWNGVQEVWLGGIQVNTNDVTTIKLRFEGLEKLMVWEELAESIIFGTVRSMEGRDWLDIDLKDDFQRPIDVRMPEELPGPFRMGRPEGHEGTGGHENVGSDEGDSMVCPFVLRL
ncbi:MAG: hypothetical protein Q9168_003430 [Polycauliona sp. 1 TL-2023]